MLNPVNNGGSALISAAISRPAVVSGNCSVNHYRVPLATVGSTLITGALPYVCWLI